MSERNKKFILVLGFAFISIILSGCLNQKAKSPRLLETTTARITDLEKQVQDIASVNSIRSKMYLKFEDNSAAEKGIAEKYATADSTIVVQRPGNILLKVEAPIIGTDIAEMSSNGIKFRIAILKDNAGGALLSFLKGTNRRDYSRLRESANKIAAERSDKAQDDVNAFSKLRPQHITDALLMSPINKDKYSYVMSAITQEEFDVNAKKQSPSQWVFRGYYLMDELQKDESGQLKLIRRFWFDRVGGIHLSREQIFDDNGEIVSDIYFGKFGRLANANSKELPLEITLSRPQEKYKIRLIHKDPNNVIIDKTYPEQAFLLENTKNLREIDLDGELDRSLGAVKSASDEQ
ncbi:MAG: hypothetical protein ACK5NT_01315 [Pyrinomonadaceae bacterium]